MKRAARQVLPSRRRQASNEEWQTRLAALEPKNYRKQVSPAHIIKNLKVGSVYLSQLPKPGQTICSSGVRKRRAKATSALASKYG